MANFTNETFSKHDDWMTPKSAWEDIAEYIPKDKAIWEAFYGDGKSGNILTELGFKDVIHQEIDFFENDLGEIVVSNPDSILEKYLVRMKIRFKLLFQRNEYNLSKFKMVKR